MKTLCALIFLLALSVNAATYYVATTGNDTTGNGSVGTPWKTVQKAANTMNSGDTVLIQAGQYNERVSVTKTGLTFDGYAGAIINGGFNNVANSTTIRGCEILNTNYVRWSEASSAGIYIQGTNVNVISNYVHDAALYGIFLQSTASTITSSNAVVRGNRCYSNECAGIVVNGLGHLIEQNEVWATVQYGPWLIPSGDTNLGGLDADGMRFFGVGHTFRSNYIHDILFRGRGLNFASGDYVNDPHADAFQTWTDSSSQRAVNCVFEYNLLDMLSYGAATDGTTNGCKAFQISTYAGYPAATGTIIRNNIMRTRSGMDMGDINGITIVHNVFASDLTTPVNPEPSGINMARCTNVTVQNNIFVDQVAHCIYIDVGTRGCVNVTTGQNMEYRTDGVPLVTSDTYYTAARRLTDYWNTNALLVAPGAAFAAANYKLQSSSPAINKGSDLASVTYDYFGTARPQMSKWDIGAYESPVIINTTTNKSTRLKGKIKFKGTITFGD